MGLRSKAHLRERATLAPRKGPFRHTDASREGVGPRAGVLAPKPRASKQAREGERPISHRLLKDRQGPLRESAGGQEQSCPLNGAQASKQGPMGRGA